MNCAGCKIKKCYLEGKDCTGKRDSMAALYRNQENSAIMTASAAVEAEGYANLTRVEELIEFSKKMGYRRLGIAFCAGCAHEAKTLQEILENNFIVESVCCKVCGIEKSEFSLKTIRDNPHETICNPLGQAALLNEAGTELNIIIGLCIGHDMLFTENSSSPVTTLLVKDRVLVNNPAGVFYSPYWKYKLQKKKDDTV
jgi:uncharacterized metal-binding protein